MMITILDPTAPPSSTHVALPKPLSRLEGAVVAVKLLTVLPGQSEDAVKRFVQEARILADLKHPVDRAPSSLRDLFRNNHLVFQVFERPEQFIECIEPHELAGRLLRGREERLLRILLREAVNDACVGTDDEFLFG